jgi:anti-anti-sigma factor
LSSMDSTSSVSAPAHVTCVDGIPVIAVSGRLDTVSSTVFDTQTASVFADRCTRVLLDMSASTYLSSAGLRSILKIIKNAAACGGRVGMFSVPPPILEILQISGFQALMDIYPDRDTALKESVGR